MKLLGFSFILMLFSFPTFAQAVDPECWYPKVGEGIDIDDHDMSIDHDFGGDLVRLHNPSDSSYYLACIGYNGNINTHTVFHSKNPLDVHHLSLF
ncbi:MAG TPA: hypothetical protein VFO76_04850, partial [Candidatus Kapabacteria bacterium]|nr:hypothetical protein [Candidatus Kapabacteria bacterium]